MSATQKNSYPTSNCSVSNYAVPPSNLPSINVNIPPPSGPMMNLSIPPPPILPSSSNAQASRLPQQVEQSFFVPQVNLTVPPPTLQSGFNAGNIGLQMPNLNVPPPNWPQHHATIPTRPQQQQNEMWTHHNVQLNTNQQMYDVMQQVSSSSHFPYEKSLSESEVNSDSHHCQKQTADHEPFQAGQKVREGLSQRRHSPTRHKDHSSDKRDTRDSYSKRDSDDFHNKHKDRHSLRRRHDDRDSIDRDRIRSKEQLFNKMQNAREKVGDGKYYNKKIDDERYPVTSSFNRQQSYERRCGSSRERHSISNSQECSSDSYAARDQLRECSRHIGNDYQDRFRDLDKNKGTKRTRNEDAHRLRRSNTIQERTDHLSRHSSVSRDMKKKTDRGSRSVSSLRSRNSLAEQQRPSRHQSLARDGRRGQASESKSRERTHSPVRKKSKLNEHQRSIRHASLHRDQVTKRDHIEDVSYYSRNKSDSDKQRPRSNSVISSTRYRSDHIENLDRHGRPIKSLYAHKFSKLETRNVQQNIDNYNLTERYENNLDKQNKRSEDSSFSEMSKIELDRHGQPKRSRFTPKNPKIEAMRTVQPDHDYLKASESNEAKLDKQCRHVDDTSSSERSKIGLDRHGKFTGSLLVLENRKLRSMSNTRQNIDSDRQHKLPSQTLRKRGNSESLVNRSKTNTMLRSTSKVSGVQQNRAPSVRRLQRDSVSSVRRLQRDSVSSVSRLQRDYTSTVRRLQRDRFSSVRRLQQDCTHSSIRSSQFRSIARLRARNTKSLPGVISARVRNTTRAGTLSTKIQQTRSTSHSSHSLGMELAEALMTNFGRKSTSIERESSKPKEATQNSWIRVCPADLYFKHADNKCVRATSKMKELEDEFQYKLVMRSSRAREGRPAYDPPKKKHVHSHGCCGHGNHSNGDDNDSSSDDNEGSGSDSGDADISEWLAELERKKNHPDRLHPDLWYNEPGEMLDGPVCRCSIKQQRSGIRHNIYPGEGPQTRLKCDMPSNNADKLYHYRITMSPHTNFLTKCPTAITHDGHEYLFEGFSLFSHYKLDHVPTCQLLRYNIQYTLHWIEEEVPQNFSVSSLDLFTRYLLYELLELIDVDMVSLDDELCSHYHIMPRFARMLDESGKELLSMDRVLTYLLEAAEPVVDDENLEKCYSCSPSEWQRYVESLRGELVTLPGQRPACFRLDQLDRVKTTPNTEAQDDKPRSEDGSLDSRSIKQSDTCSSLEYDQLSDASDIEFNHPLIVHFGIRPTKLSYVGDPKYQNLWKQYVKFKHLLANKPKLSKDDKQKLVNKERELQDMRSDNSKKREVTIEVPCKGVYKTGLRCDVAQHAMLLPVLINHFRFHRCLTMLEKKLDYQFKDRMLLQLALTHSSYRIKYGTNPDHMRNALSNCGQRLVTYGHQKVPAAQTHKRGINRLINIMARMGCERETDSDIKNYERLEFLGDAVIEFLSSIHLFFMFPGLDEGGLTTFRTAIVQNQHLAVLASKLHLDHYMLYAHGPDLCSDSVMKHAMANCLEALLGALYLDGGIDLAERVFGEVLFDDDENLLSIWKNLPPHPLQENEPNGDRHWIPNCAQLQELTKFEDMTGIQFNHIRLLAKAFTTRGVGRTVLTDGHNQRLEFLGDTVLQIVTSVYLFTHFPDHHEGHLSLLRSSLVNNITQAIICDDLGMTTFMIRPDGKVFNHAQMKPKEKADILEAYMGALYVDRGLEYCTLFCSVCFFPRLRQFIINQDWNDSKSRLQQCCLTLRGLNEADPDVPYYKVTNCNGPTNTRRYEVVVYFRSQRLAKGYGHSIHVAEMKAAESALKNHKKLFPQLNHQVRVIKKRFHV